MKYTESIKNKGTFRYLIKKGELYKGKYITMYYVSSKRKLNLFGVCVSKNNGIAVNRNKLKRWVREVYKIEEDFVKRNITLVIMYKKSVTIDMIDYYKVKEDVLKGFKELNLYEKVNI